MKKELEAELMSLAHKILQLKNKTDIHELKNVCGVLYEKMSVLSYAEKHFGGAQPTIGKAAVEESLSSNPKSDDARPDGTQHSTEEITEPNTEKIKDIVAQMPPESQQVDEVFDEIIPKEDKKAQEDFLGIGGIHYDDLPQFEEKASAKKETPKVETKESKKQEENSSKTEKKETQKEENNSENDKQVKHNEKFSGKSSLNDRLKKGIQIGLNDRLAFIKHLFDGNTEDYNRVISQLNTIASTEEAKSFIETNVKPDYNGWYNKEEYENRFLEVIENKFD
ncbi:hypothetical protein [Mesonia sp. K7]|uniref:hypothetical protein n=1 Tax=Mesonia sp. K7 TaxID=2218606 RepID=UPI000DAAA336|nr:hypothetical protein [Mesonia sp. K7]PZD77401.1 hypothetical protein DNG35_08770 [Mesonia sp. K7]